MGKCPKCKKEITYLRAESSATEIFEISLNTQGHIYWESIDFTSGEGDSDIYCPHCGEHFSNDDSVLKQILSDKKKRLPHNERIILKKMEKEKKYG